MWNCESSTIYDDKEFFQYSKRLWQTSAALWKPDKVYLDWQLADHLYNQLGINIRINFNLCSLKSYGFLSNHNTKVIVKMIYRSPIQVYFVGFLQTLTELSKSATVCQSLTVKISWDFTEKLGWIKADKLESSVKLDCLFWLR